MTIDEWLFRLNLLSLKKKFLNHKLRRVDDLKHIQGGEGELAGLELGDKLQCRRLWLMLSGDSEAKENFKYLSKHGVRSIGNIFLEKSKDVEELVSSIPDDTVTGYQLRDVFDTTKKVSEIRKKIYDMILFNKRFPKTLGHAYVKDFIDSDDAFVTPKLSKASSSKPKALEARGAFKDPSSEDFSDSDTEGQAKKSKKSIKFDLVKFFTDIGATECIKKLQKEDLLDPELFFNVEWGII
jgi:hypothetical protein